MWIGLSAQGDSVTVEPLDLEASGNDIYLGSLDIEASFWNPKQDVPEQFSADEMSQSFLKVWSIMPSIPGLY
jgi:vesicle-fusing ATPase